MSREEPERLSVPEWAELRALQAKPVSRLEDDERIRLSNLSFRQSLWAMQTITDHMMPLIKALRSKEELLPAVETVAERYAPPEIPSETTVAFARLPQLLATVSTHRSNVSAAARGRRKLASDALRGHDRLYKLWAANTPTAGPEWRVQAEFAVVADPLVVIRDRLQGDADYLANLEGDLHQASITLRALKDLAGS